MQIRKTNREKGYLEIICDPASFAVLGSFAVLFGDHLLSGTICGPIWGSFAVRDNLRPWDYLRYILGINCGPGSFAANFRYSSKCFAEIYRAQYENALLVPPWYNMAAGKYIV